MKVIRITDEAQFKTYDELKARLDSVLAVETPPVTESVARPTSKPKTAEETATTGDEDEDMSYFAKLAEDN